MAFSILYNMEDSIRGRLYLADCLKKIQQFDASNINFQAHSFCCNLKDPETGTCTWNETYIESTFQNYIGSKKLNKCTLERFRNDMNFTKGLEPRQQKFEHFYNEQMDVTDNALADQYLRVHAAMQYITHLCFSLWEEYSRDEVAFFVKYNRFNRFGLVNMLIARTSRIPSFHFWLFYILIFLVKCPKYLEDPSGNDLFEEWTESSCLKSFLEEITLSDLVTFAPFIRVYYLEHIEELCVSCVWNNNLANEKTPSSFGTSPGEKLVAAWEDMKVERKKDPEQPQSLTSKHRVMMELDKTLLSMCIFLVDRNYFRDAANRENIYIGALLGSLGNDGRKHIHNGQKILKRRKIKKCNLPQYVTKRFLGLKGHSKFGSWDLYSTREFYSTDSGDTKDVTPSSTPRTPEVLHENMIPEERSNLEASSDINEISLPQVVQRELKISVPGPAGTESVVDSEISSTKPGNFFKRDYERFFTRSMRLLAESEKAFFCCLLQICLYLAILHFNSDSFNEIDNIDPRFRNLIAIMICLFIFFYSLRFQKCEFPMNFLSIIFRVNPFPRVCMAMDFLVNVIFGIMLPYLTPFLLRGSGSLDSMLFNAIAVYFVLDLDDLLVTQNDRMSMEDDLIFTYIFLMQEPAQARADYTSCQRFLKYECHLAKLMSLVSSVSCIVGILFLFNGQTSNISFFSRTVSE